MDVGFVNDDVVYHLYAGGSGRCRWSPVLVSGELKSNPMADAPPVVWINPATYAREVLSAQDARRFVLAFSLCRFLSRLWQYDRPREIASEQFDINDSKGALEFVAIMLGFLWMDEERLGFDPTIRTILLYCWKSNHLQEGRSRDDPQTAFAIKDSWRCPERDDEGEILREVTQQGAIDFAQYCYYETVCIRDTDNDIRNSVSTGLGITTAVAPTATTDAVTTPDSTATTIMANVTTAGDTAAIIDTVTTTRTIARRAYVLSISTASTIAVAATTRRRCSTAEQGKKKTPRVQ
ncbi:hypothetical protein Trisim1_010537 [Trichoderma cf. simile WF8]|uniref:Fungal-type protein kinase domain-containing protein n=1 Tax=Trichoderma guizhouense TaxID=1491466 RepID=A0A1T3CCL7_9HYPO|nr:hypothetical protein A0O28_0019300 [Trichoderma guizhouense]